MQIIAEAGVNHNGDPELAAELIRASARAGADIVKFQTFKADKLVTRQAVQANYQQRNLGSAAESSQFEMLRKLELDFALFHDLKAECILNKVRFLSTPFDIDSALYLVDNLGETLVKIGSGDFDNYPLLITLARRGVDIILSTGMSTLGEIEVSLGALAFGYLAPTSEQPSVEAFMAAFSAPQARAVLAEKVTVLHCTTEYPAPPEGLNLRVIPLIAQAFGVRTGFSDHSQGSEAAIAAYVLGASMLEKHITLDCSMSGPDHKASMEPDDFARMVQALKNTEISLGDGIKRMMSAETANKGIARKSPVAAVAIRAGEMFTEANVTLKRARGGAAAGQYYRLLGQICPRDLAADDVIL
jgi:N-acetylneuraminate synthase